LAEKKRHRNEFGPVFIAGKEILGVSVDGRGFTWHIGVTSSIDHEKTFPGEEEVNFCETWETSKTFVVEGGHGLGSSRKGICYPGGDLFCSSTSCLTGLVEVIERFD
jgi:hypothetical protein